MSTAFPTISGIIDNTDCTDELAFNPSLTTPFTSGYQQTSTRVSFVPKHFVRHGRFLTASDKSTLETFEQAVNYCQDTFEWPNSANGSTTYYQVRLSSPMKFVKEEGEPNLWRCTFEFIQTSTFTYTLSSGDYSYGDYGDGLYG